MLVRMKAAVIVADSVAIAVAIAGVIEAAIVAPVVMVAAGAVVIEADEAAIAGRDGINFRLSYAEHNQTAGDPPSPAVSYWLSEDNRQDIASYDPESVESIVNVR